MILFHIDPILNRIKSYGGRLSDMENIIFLSEEMMSYLDETVDLHH